MSNYGEVYVYARICVTVYLIDTLMYQSQVHDSVINSRYALALARQISRCVGGL